jgi:signal peptidase
MEIDYKEILSYAIILIIVLIAAQHLNVVVSGSMEPAFYRGDIVVVEKANFFGIHEFDPNSVEVGDVVVYNAAWYDQPVIHRIINITDINGSTMYVIRGTIMTGPTLIMSNQVKFRKRSLHLGIIWPLFQKLDIFPSG